jgi:uncharacterized SAM-binding protein YcdF (DUF218 family)
MLTRILHPALRAQRLALTALAALLLTAGTPVRAESWDHLAFLERALRADRRHGAGAVGVRGGRLPGDAQQ